MRVSVDIEHSLLLEVMSLTGEKGKSPALAKAIAEFVRRRKAAQFGRMIREGAFDYPHNPADDTAANPVPPLPEG